MRSRANATGRAARSRVQPRSRGGVPPDHARRDRAADRRGGRRAAAVDRRADAGAGGARGARGRVPLAPADPGGPRARRPAPEGGAVPGPDLRRAAAAALGQGHGVRPLHGAVRARARDRAPGAVRVDRPAGPRRRGPRGPRGPSRGRRGRVDPGRGHRRLRGDHRRARGAGPEAGGRRPRRRRRSRPGAATGSARPHGDRRRAAVERPPARGDRRRSCAASC